MNLFERIDLIAKEKCGSRKVLADKLGIPQTTFNGYFNDKGQKNFRGEHLERIFVLFPDVNPFCLLTGRGEMFGPSNVVTTPDMEGKKTKIEEFPGPITEAVAEVEKALAGVDELVVIKAAIGKLETLHQNQARKRGGYGSQLEAREPQFHEDQANYPADACGINDKPPTNKFQYGLPESSKPKE